MHSNGALLLVDTNEKTHHRQILSQHLASLRELCHQEFTLEDYEKCKTLTRQVAILTYRHIVSRRTITVVSEVLNKSVNVKLVSRHRCRWEFNTCAPVNTLFCLASSFWASPSILSDNKGVSRIGVAPYQLAFLGGPLGLLHEIGHLYSAHFVELYDLINAHLPLIKTAMLARKEAKTTLSKAVMWGVSERAFLPEDIRNSLNLLDSQSESEAWEWAVQQAQELKMRGFDLLTEIGKREDIDQFIEACLSTHQLSYVRDMMFGRLHRSFIQSLVTSKSL